MQQLVQSFSDSLFHITKDHLKDIVSIRPDIDIQVYDHLYENYPYFLNDSDYTLMGNKLRRDSVNYSIGSSYRQLTGPGGTFLRKIILNDPLYLTSGFFKALGSNNKELIVEEGLVFNKNRTHVLITAITTYGSDNSEHNLKLYESLENFKQRWNTAHAANTMDYFGTFEIAAQNELQVKKDTQITVTITLIILLLILFIYYRKILVPFYFILSPLFGAFFAIGIIGYIHPQIAAISLATGAVLMGIILDYSFHFFTHLRHTRSISITVKEISSPLLTGSFTTITAFSALQFANSPVLQDFGLFAGLCLSGAAFFTLVCLPVILRSLSFDYEKIPDEPFTFKLPSFSKKFKYVGLVAVGVLTIFFLYHSGDVRFDDELENMSFHSTDLKLKEQELTGTDPVTEKRLYVFATDASYESACEHNFALFKKIENLRKKYALKNIVSTGYFLIPQKLKKEREEKWLSFWSERKKEVFLNINHAADSVGFNQSAFVSYENWIERKHERETNADSILKALGLNNLVRTENGKTTFVTSFVVGLSEKNALKAELAELKGLEIFDRSEIATQLLTSVKDDFNYILLLSALVVFCTLLLIYGRIELALFAFFPMLISWIWIIGIAALMNIKFNFVNVVISTFIFGLGDDYSIFITDGLLNRYKYGKRSLGSYSSAIILSAICTIVGTGALFFAKHPATHSIATVSVLGMGCILFLSLIFQPIFFEMFVQGRVDAKKPPVAIIEFVISVFEFSYWIIVCLSFYIISLVLIILPVTRKTKVYILNVIISFFARSVIYLGIHIKKNIIDKHHLDLKKPSIIIANHSSFLDILLVIMLNPRIIILVKDWVYKSPLFGPFIRMAGYVYSESGTVENLERIKQRMDDGYSILIFPEGTRSPDGNMQRFHKGAFFLAQHLKVDITPILIYGASFVLPKNDYLVRRGILSLKILPRIPYSNESWGLTYNERAKKISAYFKSEYAIFKDQQETAKTLWGRVFYNYIFKGPVTEWYVKIKWKLESYNYEYYNTLIDTRKRIMDIGCGYGYLSIFLHYKNANRQIMAIDYDEEKINIAANIFDKSDHLRFVHANLTEMEMETQDVIILGDVLHYLSEKEQTAVLEKCHKALDPNGIILIRDGITDLGKKHEKTQLSEVLSTRIFKFNKKENDFHFFSSEFIRSFASQYGYKYEMREQSNTTSNVLFILRK